MATTEPRVIGKPIIRKEDPELITGRGSFVDNISVPGMLWAHIVRSPFAHATIKGVDVSGALRCPDAWRPSAAPIWSLPRRSCARGR